MFVLQNLVFSLAWLVSNLLGLYWWLVVAAVVLSWVSPDPYNPIVRFIRSVTEPVLSRVRRALPFLYLSGIDLSPIVVLLGVEFLRLFLAGSLYQLAGRLPGSGYGFN